MSTPPAPRVTPFSQAEPYTQPEPPGAAFNWLVKQNEIEGICLGLVTLTGPIHKTPAAHAEWDQIYIVMDGEGTMHLADKSIPIKGPTTIIIPRNTMHSMQVPAGKTVKYVFVNEYF